MTGVALDLQVATRGKEVTGCAPGGRRRVGFTLADRVQVHAVEPRGEVLGLHTHDHRTLRCGERRLACRFATGGLEFGSGLATLAGRTDRAHILGCRVPGEHTGSGSLGVGRLFVRTATHNQQRDGCGGCHQRGDSPGAGQVPERTLRHG